MRQEIIFAESRVVRSDFWFYFQLSADHEIVNVPAYHGTAAQIFSTRAEKHREESESNASPTPIL